MAIVHNSHAAELMNNPDVVTLDEIKALLPVDCAAIANALSFVEADLLRAEMELHNSAATLHAQIDVLKGQG